jgi:hypothetical protein
VGSSRQYDIPGLSLTADGPSPGRTWRGDVTTRKCHVRSPLWESRLALVHEHWDTLVHVFRTFESKRPILLYDVQEKRLYAYPYQGFVEDMSAKERPVIAQSYERVLAGETILVFVRDNEKRKLVSFNVELLAAA